MLSILDCPALYLLYLLKIEDYSIPFSLRDTFLYALASSSIYHVAYLIESDESSR